MTRDETKAAIKIMQSYVDGKEILYDGCSMNNPAWTGNFAKYTVKPEPRECYVLLDMDGKPSIVLNPIHEPTGERVILMREVLND